MPPFIPLPNGIRLTANFTYAGQACVNVFHLQTAAPPSTLDLTNACASFANTWINTLRLNFVDSLNLTRIVAADWTTQNGQVVNYLTGLPSPGGLNQGGLPGQVAIVTTHQTSKRGRSFRGRTYHMGISEVDVDGNVIDGVRQAAIQSAMGTLRSVWSGGGLTWVVASFYANKAPRVTGVATPVTSVRTGLVVDTQRRRIPRQPV